MRFMGWGIQVRFLSPCLTLLTKARYDQIILVSQLWWWADFLRQDMGP